MVLMFLVVPLLNCSSNQSVMTLRVGFEPVSAAYWYKPYKPMPCVHSQSLHPEVLEFRLSLDVHYLGPPTFGIDDTSVVKVQ